MKGVKNVANRFHFGNIAVPLAGKKASDSDHTHKWTVMVRELNNETQVIISKRSSSNCTIHTLILCEVMMIVVGISRNSCTHVAVEQPPFEVQETGWGEFEITIKIYFQPVTNDKPVTVYHHLDYILL